MRRPPPWCRCPPSTRRRPSRCSSTTCSSRAVSSLAIPTRILTPSRRPLGPHTSSAAQRPAPPRSTPRLSGCSSTGVFRARRCSQTLRACKTGTCVWSTSTRGRSSRRVWMRRRSKASSTTMPCVMAPWPPTFRSTSTCDRGAPWLRSLATLTSATELRCPRPLPACCCLLSCRTRSTSTRPRARTSTNSWSQPCPRSQV
mmetsp:Transcript_21458/g.43040  ORF Transcript_21458/g.43040 Transcript_21458/m.43040 type:complete len:200 (+) Transcript_21458:113-712(+)